MQKDQYGVTRRSSLRIAAGAVAGGVLLAGCGGSGVSAGGTTPSVGPRLDGTPVRGGDLRIGWISGGRGETLKPGQALNNVDILRASALFDGLYTLGEDGKPKPALAESGEPNRDGTVWTIRLRSGVTWHDGRPLTAGQVAEALNGVIAGTDNYYAAQLAFLMRSARAKGDREVVLTMKRPVADVPGVLSYYPYLITRSDSFSGSKVIGTGAFKFASFTPGTRSVFEANTEYWGGAPYVDRLVNDSSFGDETARTNALLAGAIDIVPALPPALAKANASSSRIVIGRAAGVATYYFQCRVDLDPFKDPKVMKALRLSVDRDAMIQSVFSGYAQKGNDLTGPGLPYFASDLPVPAHDPEQARALLKAAGKSDLRLTLRTAAAYPGYVEGATLYAEQAKAAGIAIDVRKSDPATYYTPQGGYLKYPMFTGFPGGGSSVPSLTSVYITNLYSKGGSNETHYGDAKTDALLADAIGELDEVKAKEKWHAVQQLQYDRGGSITFGVGDYVDGYGTKVRGITTTRAGWVNNFNVAKAWLATS